MSNPPFSHPRWVTLPGIVAALLMILIVVSAMLALIWMAPALPWASLWQDAYLQRIVRFSLWQATLSSLLVVLLAIPLARALLRRPAWPGRKLLLRIMELTLVLPPIVVVFGLVAVHGRQGWLPQLLSGLGWQPPNYLYGLGGILLAHIFYNVPLCARLLLQELERIPSQHWRLAAQLGLNSRGVWLMLEWPVVRRALPRLLALVFTLCFTSFAIVMTLGGGPRATTLEVAIYQALRFDMDIGSAALLAILQLLICALLWVVSGRLGGMPSLTPYTLYRHWPRADSLGSSRYVDSGWIGMLWLLLLPPLLAVVLNGLGGIWLMLGRHELWAAWWLSIKLALVAGGLATILATLLLSAAGGYVRRGDQHISALTEASGHLTLLIPAMVLGTGWFVLLRPWISLTEQGYSLVVFANTLMCLPFLMQVLRGPLNSLDEPSRRLADTLDVRGWYRWRWLLWPRLKPAMALALAYGMTYSIGDFSVVALFGSPSQPTLPLLLYQLLGSYRLREAAGCALLMLLTMLMIFLLLEWLGRRGYRSERERSSP